jgi:hypothetical protein
LRLVSVSTGRFQRLFENQTTKYQLIQPRQKPYLGSIDAPRSKFLSTLGLCRTFSAMAARPQPPR